MFRSLFRSWLCLGFALAASLSFGQRNLKEIPPTDPEIERQALKLPAGFEINLFAADPQIAKPIQMNFDSRGRLWIAASATYPQIKPGDVPSDKILVVEDVDGDGRADKTTVFADGLLIPTGVEPGDGGAYVANSTEILHLRDTDGDGRADEERVVLSGFGTEDTHHILHTFRWGHDGMLYFNQSIYIHSHVETPYGVRRLGGGGIWQFRPETMRLEVFARGMVNSWGHHFDRFGQSFGTDGAGGEGIHYILPGASYAATPGAARILRGLNPGSPKYCGAEIVSGRHLPDDWQGNIITNDFRANRTCRFAIKEDGSGYAAVQQEDLVRSTHPAYRPIDVKMGPDGAIYIADWYNPIIQHGEVDFRDPRRDHTHGRIWRITCKDRPLVARPKLAGASVADLLAALKSPEGWTRHHARLTLRERGAAQVLPQLESWLAGLDPQDPELESLLLEGLWTKQALRATDPALLTRLVRARDHRVRAAAQRVIVDAHEQLPQAMALLAAGVADEHPRVRLEAVRALAQTPAPQSIELAMLAMERPVDVNIEYALWLTARESAPRWLPAFEQGQLQFGGRVAQLAFALQAAGSTAAVAPLLKLVREGQLPRSREADVLTLVAGLGNAADLGQVWQLVAAEQGLPADRKAGLLDALAQAARERKVVPAGDLSAVAALLSAQAPELRAAAARAAGAWKLEALRATLAGLAAEGSTSPELRGAAFEALADLGGEASRRTLAELADAPFPPAIRTPAISALAALDLNQAAGLAADALSAQPADEDVSRIVESFLARKQGAEALAKSFAVRPLAQDPARVALRTLRLSGRDAPQLSELLTKAAKITGGPRQLSPEQMTALLDEVRTQGDPARGEAVFRRADLGCLKCHSIAGAGGSVGPDLLSIGAAAPPDYLVDALLVPNKAVKENYHALVVSTTAGKVFTGIKVRQTKGELLLRDAEDRDLAIPLAAIDEQAPTRSLMPDGLTDTLARRDLVDLLRFLSELGKPGPYAAAAGRVIRRWEGAAGSKWQPVVSQVSGQVPLAEVPQGRHRPVGTAEMAGALVRFDLEVTTPGRVKLRWNSPAGLQRVDGEALRPAEAVTVLDLPSGRQTLVWFVDPQARKEPLHCEILEPAAGEGRAQPAARR